VEEHDRPRGWRLQCNLCGQVMKPFEFEKHAEMHLDQGEVQNMAYPAPKEPGIAKHIAITIGIVCRHCGNVTATQDPKGKCQHCGQAPLQPDDEPLDPEMQEELRWLAEQGIVVGTECVCGAIWYGVEEFHEHAKTCPIMKRQRAQSQE